MGVVNFACNCSGHVDCVGGRLLSYYVGKVAIPELETHDNITAEGVCGFHSSIVS